MAYMSSREAAQKWGVSLRNVQRLLTEGRIEGAQKCGGAWVIPADAAKPGDPRRARKSAGAHPFVTLPRDCPILIHTSLYSIPGSAEDVAASLAGDTGAQTLFRCMLAYQRGDMTLAAALGAALPVDASRPDLLLGAAVTRGLCAMYRGNVKTWLSAVEQVRSLPCETDEARDARDFQLADLALALYEWQGVPGWLREGDFDRLSPDSWPLARFLYMKYHMLERGDPGVALLARPFASQNRLEGGLVSEIYCRLMLAIACHEQGQLASAAREIDRALDLALPDGIIAPLAEYRNDLGTLLDERLALRDEAALRAVRTLHRQLTEGWTSLNVALCGVTYTPALTPQEHHAAKLACRGLTNAEIARRMGVAVSTVKGHISRAIGKTGASGRADLAQYIAMEPRRK